MPQILVLDLLYRAPDTVNITLPDPYTWDDVTDWEVRWDACHLTFTDGTQLTLDLDLNPEPDCQRPIFATIHNGREVLDTLLALDHAALLDRLTDDGEND